MLFLTKLGQHINEMMAIAVKHFLNFIWYRFRIIKQIVAWPPVQFYTVVCPPAKRIAISGP